MSKVTAASIRQEMERRKSKTGQMLTLLKKRGELTTADLSRFGMGASSRLHELRREGHIIPAHCEKPNFFRYVYLGQREIEDKSKSRVSE